ncbi:MAG: nickel-dependent hydrogenase large subunit [Bradyrhizobium sp.]|uniref:nickel-dependent hydrogenase large subunit n=1 Tax=Bradyrhizobium sp. TaxID=376 RepID=UPI0025BE9B30|nr:nickel-dependent hydrogenase large subunit [Bradyrhizobium sp.]MBI5260617.1 nickel-dependent hydrogenase large subunit [Bradyrhizobium sp.]
MSIAFRNEIDVTVAFEGNVIRAVEILPRARPPLTRLFAGKPASSLLSVLPRLFSLCSAAHQVAFVSAVEAARGEDANPEVKQQRMKAVVAERLTELVRGLFLGRSAPDQASAAILRELLQTLAVIGGGSSAGDVRRQAVSRISTALASLGISRDAAPKPGSALAHQLANLEDGALAPVALAPSFLSAADDRDIAVRLIAEGTTFSDAPDLDGRIPETGVWARHSTWSAATPDRGGPAERLKAKIAEAGRLGAWLEGDEDRVLGESSIESYRLGAGQGTAAVECARGRLYHAVELDREGRIVRFEFLAPTEWNFHTRGPLVRALEGAAVEDGLPGREAVRALVGSFDPCVGFNLTFREAVHA